MYENYIDVCEDILLTGHSDDADETALAIQEGYIVRDADGKLIVTSTAFTKEQKDEFYAIADRYLAPLMDEYSGIVERFITGYKKLFPKYLEDDTDRMCNGMFVGLYKAIIEFAQRTGDIELPSPDSFCDVMLQI
ncbi:hypothetical protein SDC9_192226 [bioreactor metagenome]|uniref:Uncharacterized protein n=1 Tax=bioreactor metagenome TaxID=1076179 RepID=A0A645I038_9ZZZZ